uniref:Receptor expression-enhancing protein n=1 Tax=Aceria tosichella TaxID=561515 RepID=A0A6G1SJE7_9ACAR
MSQYYQLFVNKLETLVHDNKSVLTPYFERVEKLTGVKRVVIAQALIGILLLYLIVGRAAQFVCNLIGFVFPAYRSLVALETSNKEDDSKWLTYWVVFAALSVVEFFSDVLLSWFPLYWIAKVAFLLWCSADIPNGGSAVIYSRVIRPIFLKHAASKGSSPANSSPSANSNNNKEN